MNPSGINIFESERPSLGHRLLRKLLKPLLLRIQAAVDELATYQRRQAAELQELSDKLQALKLEHTAAVRRLARFEELYGKLPTQASDSQRGDHAE